MSPVLSRSCRSALPPALLLLCAGCLPGVAWLPDSSGFYYADGKECKTLAHYDLKTKKSRAIVKDTDAITLWPGLSPDGKQLAVARWWQEKDRPSTLQVIVYDTAGKERKRSRVFPYIKAPVDNARLGPCIVLWGTADKVIVLTDELAIYDVAQDRLTRVPDAAPLTGGNSPARPDGKGFLAKVGSGDKAELAFIDWDGKIEKIAGPVADEESLPWSYTVDWKKNLAVVSGRKGTLRVDTEKKKFTRQDGVAAKLLAGPGKVEGCFAFPGGRQVLCVFRRDKAEPGEAGPDTIELQDLAAATRKVVLAGCNAVPTFFPAPDRKKVVVRIEEGPLKTPKILVIDDAGKVLATVTLEGE